MESFYKSVKINVEAEDSIPNVIEHLKSVIYSLTNDFNYKCGKISMSILDDSGKTSIETKKKEDYD